MPSTSQEDDGMLAWNTLSSTHRPESTVVYDDIMRARSWGILHQPRCLTYARLSPAGQHSWVLNMTGFQIWVIFKLKPKYSRGTQEESNQMLLNLFKPEYMLASKAFGRPRLDFDKPLPWEKYVDMELFILQSGHLL